MPSTWNDDTSSALRSFVESGDMSYARIAMAINSRFGTRYSRNATIGRAGRMGLINPCKIKTIKVEKRRQPHKPRVRAKIVNGGLGSMRVIKVFESIEQIKLRCAEVVPLNLTLMELDEVSCRYPSGDGPITFCGHRRAEPSSYCIPHMLLCKGDGTASERAAAKGISNQMQAVA